MKEYGYTPFTSRVKDCEVEFIKSSLHYEGEPWVEAPRQRGLTLIPNSCNDGWGFVGNHIIMTQDKWPMPNRLELRYVTTDDGRCYAIDTPLDEFKAAALWDEQKQKFPKDAFCDYVVGTGPYGFIAIWLQGRARSRLLHSFRAEEAEYDEAEKRRFGWLKNGYVHQNVTPEEMELNMRQFCYRYVTLEEHWDNRQWKWVEYEDDDPYYDDLLIDSLEDHRCDGSFNYVMGDMSQLDYHEAGMPDRITVRWHAGREEYLAHFWLEMEEFSKIFIKYCNMHPDSRVDIMLRMDTKEQVYVMALKAEGEEKHTPLPWYLFQLVVFKDGIEHYKSPNYRLEKGQWSWTRLKKK